MEEVEVIEGGNVGGRSGRRGKEKQTKFSSTAVIDCCLGCAIGHIGKIPKASKHFWTITKDHELAEVAAGSYIWSVRGGPIISQDATASICGGFDLTPEKLAPPSKKQSFSASDESV